MEAIQRELLSNYWITLVIIFAFSLLFLLKLLSPYKLKGYASAIFNKGFLELELEETKGRFSFFQGILFLFSALVFSLIIYFIKIEYIAGSSSGFLAFLTVFVFVFGYFSFKRIIEFLLVSLFSLKPSLQFFLFFKNSYFYALALVFSIVLIFYVFGLKNPIFLLVFLAFLFLIRTSILLANNKNLILSKLFYFILYLCTLEIAPLFLLLKRMF